MSARERLVSCDIGTSTQIRAWSEREYLSTADAYAARDSAIWSNPTGTARALEDLMGRCRPSSVLELGVGTGRYFPFLRGTKYIGVDLCSAMLRHARDRVPMLRACGFSEVAVVEEEVIRFLARPEHACSFDFVFSIGCVGYHVPVGRRLMQLIHAALTPGGRLFLQTTQQSLLRRAREWGSHRASLLLGRPSNHGFFVSTNERSLRYLARTAQLETEWVREDSRRFFGKPVLLSCYRRAALD